MGLLNLNIDSLALHITNVGGHEHRVRPIAARAAAIFAEKVPTYCRDEGLTSQAKNLGKVSASPVGIDLSTMTDEHAAQSIAFSWLDALKLRLY